MKEKDEGLLNDVDVDTEELSEDAVEDAKYLEDYSLPLFKEIPDIKKSSGRR